MLARMRPRGKSATNALDRGNYVCGKAAWPGAAAINYVADAELGALPRAAAIAAAGPVTAGRVALTNRQWSSGLPDSGVDLRRKCAKGIGYLNLYAAAVIFELSQGRWQ